MIKQITVLLVDNEEVFREGLAKLLKEERNIAIVLQCHSGNEAIRKSKESSPDVVLIDSEISECDALDAVREIARHSLLTKVALISRPETGLNPVDVLKAGGRGCLAKNISINDLIKSIDLISSGRIIVSPLFAEKFLQEVSTERDGDDREDAEKESVLSEREMEIVRLVTRGATNKEIASELFIAENTVKVHVKNILDKLELRNRQQVAAYAVLQNWVTSSSDIEEDSNT
ncbi:MAG: response regulator transcription factor [Chloroflexota bacterium]